MTPEDAQAARLIAMFAIVCLLIGIAVYIGCSAAH